MKALWAFAQRYENRPFTKKQLKDRSMLIDFTQGAGIEYIYFINVLGRLDISF